MAWVVRPTVLLMTKHIGRILARRSIRACHLWAVMAGVGPKDDAVTDASRRKILMIGPRRAGKTSICKVVYESFQPNDTLFLTPTMRTQKVNIDTFQALQLLDVPGSALANWVTDSPRASDADERGPRTKMAFDIPWTDVSAVIYVVDAQDEYFDALVRLNAVIVAAYMENPDIHVHVFINKVDGLSEDYKYDTQRDIEQRVYEGLLNSTHELQGVLDEDTRLDKAVCLQFYLTSVFDASAFLAFSRIQQRLLQGAESEVQHAPPGMVSLSDALETACNLLCMACYFEKAYVFDVPSRTFVGCDTSPFDASLYNIVFRYMHFLLQFSELYAQVPDAVENPVRTRDWSTSVMRLSHDTTVAFWQLDHHLALLAVIHTNVQLRNATILDYNLGLFRDAVAQLAALARS